MIRLKKTLALLSTLAAVLALMLGSAAAARSVRIAGPQTLQLVDETGQLQTEWAIAATIQDVLQLDNILYVACGPQGVLVFDLTTSPQPALLERIAEGRNVVKLAHNGQSLLVVAADFAALTYSLADPRQPVPTAIPLPAGGAPSSAGPPRTVAAGQPLTIPSPASAAQRELTLNPEGPRAPQAGWARVTAVRGGSVAIVSSVPVQIGDRFVVRSQRRVKVSAPTAEHPLYAPSNRAMGMFVVTQTSGFTASGPLPRGTVAAVGDLAEPTPAPLRAPKVAPRLWYGMGRFSATVRPVIEVGGFSSSVSSGLGLLSDVTFEYYFRVPIKLGVQLAPLGLVTGDRTGFSGELRALLAFSSSYFELGIEPGVEVHVIEQTSFLVGYGMRLGSLDGLNLILHNAYALMTSTGRLEFASMTGEINIPVASRFNLYITGGGSAYWGYGTLGLKYFLRGGGGPGTVIVQSAVGGAYLSDHCQNSSFSTRTNFCQSAQVSGVGPAIALGVDARF